jgi:hypothetical protein
VKRVGTCAQAARLLPERDGALAGQQPARQAVARPLPGAVQRPGEVLERIAEVHHLPVEDAADRALRIDQEVPGAEVAVHDAGTRGRRRRVAAQPAQCGARDRLQRERVLVDHALPVLELAAPALAGRCWAERLPEPEPRRLGSMQRAEDAPLLLADLLAPGEERSAEERLRARLAAPDLLHHEEGALEPALVGLEPQHFRHRYRAAAEGAQGLELAGAVGLDQAPDRVAAQDQPALDGLAVAKARESQPPGLARGAAVDAGEPVDADLLRAGPAPGDVGGEAFGQVLHARMVAQDG